MDICNAHVGQGFDYHYHGDPFGNSSSYNCMYSADDYSSDETEHPPLTGWGADGFSVYGRYISDQSLGYNVTLDDCGGHTHDSLPYHYHAHVIKMNKSGFGDFYAFIGGPHKCWRGNISTVPEFWVNGQPACKSWIKFVG